MINKVKLQYLTRQIVTNKNSPTEMNYQLRKMESQTTHNQTTHNKHYHKNKS